MAVTIGDSISDSIEKHCLKNYRISFIGIKFLKMLNGRVTFQLVNPQMKIILCEREAADSKYEKIASWSVWHRPKEEKEKGRKENKLMGDPAVWLSSEPGATLTTKRGAQATW